MSPRLLLPLLAVLSVVCGVTAWAVAHAPGPDDDRTVSPEMVAPNAPFLSRLDARLEVTAAVLRGDLTLDQAAAQFRGLNGDAAVARLRDLYPAADEGELPYRQVIHFAAADPRVTESLRAERLRTLHAEFYARFPTASRFPEQCRP